MIIRRIKQNMISIQILCLATAGIGAYLYRLYHPFADKRQDNVIKLNTELKSEEETDAILCKLLNNYFKVKANPNWFLGPPDEDDNTSVTDFVTPSKPVYKECNGVSYKTPSPRKWEVFCDHELKNPPTFWAIKKTYNHGRDIKVCRHIASGLPNWSIELLTRDKLECHHSCRYCASLREGYVYRKKDTKYENDPKFMKKYRDYCKWNIDPCVFHALPPSVSHSRFQSSSLWDDFYHYIIFLTEEQGDICVCSGPLFTTRKVSKRERKLYEEDGNDNLREELTHFYKVIIIQNPDSNCVHYECFLFPYNTTLLENPKLADFRVSKSSLEEKLQIKLFPDVPQYHVGQNFTLLDDFTPHRNCTYCFPSDFEPCMPEQILPPGPPGHFIAPLRKTRSRRTLSPPVPLPEIHIPIPQYRDPPPQPARHRGSEVPCEHEYKLSLKNMQINPFTKTKRPEKCVIF